MHMNDIDPFHIFKNDNNRFWLELEKTLTLHGRVSNKAFLAYKRMIGEVIDLDIYHLPNIDGTVSEQCL